MAGDLLEFLSMTVKAGATAIAALSTRGADGVPGGHQRSLPLFPRKRHLPWCRLFLGDTASTAGDRAAKEN